MPGELHGQRSLAGYSPWGCKESDMTEQSMYSIHVCWTYFLNHAPYNKVVTNNELKGGKTSKEVVSIEWGKHKNYMERGTGCPRGKKKLNIEKFR